MLCEDKLKFVRTYGSDNRCQLMDSDFSPQTPRSKLSESWRAGKGFHDEYASICQQEILAAYTLLKVALKKRRP
jgi:hypothetical protein